MSETNAAAPAAAEKSDGQALLERLLAQFKRFNRIRQELDKVRISVAPLEPPAPALANPPAEPETKATSFFVALRLLADGNDQVADELERSVRDLGALF